MRPFNLLGHKTLRDLDPSDIDKLICVEGMVTRTSTVIPDLRWVPEDRPFSAPVEVFCVVTQRFGEPSTDSEEFLKYYWVWCSDFDRFFLRLGILIDGIGVCRDSKQEQFFHAT